MTILVTGANGFAGSWLVRALLASDRVVVGAAGPGDGARILTPEEQARVTWLELDLLDAESVRQVAQVDAEAVVHLAGVASVRDSLTDPAHAWAVNALGTVRLLEVLGERHRLADADPTVLVVSTGEVYGPGPARARTEDDPLRPCSPYAASKVATELAAREIAGRTGLRVVVARPFPHTGPGQSPRFVVPAFAQRLLLARRTGAPVVKTGNLEPVRDLLDVRDVVAAYQALLTRGEPGATYNIASGDGLSLEALFGRLAALVGRRVVAEWDPALARPVDIPHLVGDPRKLQAATGWLPQHTLDQTLHDVLDAQTN